MQNNNVNWKLVIALLIAGFLTGYYVSSHPREEHAPTSRGGNLITVSDTLRITSIRYKTIPGSDYNIDSLVTVINRFWKDSLKNLYGKGLFEAKYSKSDALGKRDYTLASRIPIDPESQLTVNESFTFPKKTIGIIGSIGPSASFGLKYYIVDSKHFSFSGLVSADYQIFKKEWAPDARLEIEINY